jgi:single-stranded-DNA-specific exonuclease
LKIWKTVASNQAWVRQIGGELGLPPAVAAVLGGLGFSDLAAIRRFLAPRLADLSDPDLLPGMAPAVRRIWRAIDAGETIAVCGDYDVDGITSAGLLTTVLTRLGAAKVVPCLPRRLEEGYGLSPAALERCLQLAQPQLLVTVDCGTGAVEAVRLAARSGVEVIVTDHHEVSGALPEAQALVNPKLGADASLKMLAGVGVVFKVCHALVKEGRRCGRAGAQNLDLRDYLDWVAVGTVADVVSLRGENRILVRHGLAVLNRSAAAGWTALREVAGLRKTLTAYHIAYGLGPRLNAAGRLDTAERSLELLLTGDPRRAQAIARELDAANRERQALEAQILREAQAEIDAAYDPAAHFGLVVGRAGWHAGVIGIVASRLAARYRRPVAVIAFDEDGAGRGSCRSIEDYHLLRGLEQCREHLLTFGGHEMAAGLEIERGRLDAFRAAFNVAAARELSARDLRPVQPVHAWLELEQVDWELLAAVEQLEPFGQDNPQPVFAARGVRLAQPPRRVGEKHLRLTLAAGDKQYPAIGFGLGERVIPEGPLDVAFYLQRDNFNGADALQLNLRDFRPAE